MRERQEHKILRIMIKIVHTIKNGLGVGGDEMREWYPTINNKTKGKRTKNWKFNKYLRTLKCQRTIIVWIQKKRAGRTDGLGWIRSGW